MPRPATEIIDRLGADGLQRALEDLLDQSRLVRLATACGIKYRGMRTQSQSRNRLVADVAQKARGESEVRTTVLRALDKEASKATREWEGLNADEQVLRLSDDAFLQSDGNVGLHLYLLARSAEGSALDGQATRLAQAHLLRLAANGAAKPAAAAATPREDARLRRQVQQRERKIGHLEGQLAKARDAQKAAKQDLIQRKGELAESRMLVERLRQELAQAQTAAQALSGTESGGVSDKAVGELTRGVRRLASEQKKLVHHVRGLTEKKTSSTDTDGTKAILAALKRLDARITAEAEERGAWSESLAKRVDALRKQVGKTRATPAAKAAKRSRAKGESRRVGVFIDVQNMYYAARRLKGKLDFEALLQAAVQERRLIRATAYVVESKETDQTQFIDVLQKLAIEVRRKTVQVRADGSRKGDWDMELALDILDAARELDVVVLVSGDGDFTSLVRRVKSMGPRVEVIAFPRNTAKSLVKAADSYQPLDRKFMIYTRPAGARAKPASSESKGASKSAGEPDSPPKK